MALTIVFAGTAEFAVPALEALLHSRHRVIGVYTQPDRPAGRGLMLQASAIKQVALRQQLPVLQPENLRDPAAQQQLKELNPDIMVVAVYGLLLPAAVLNTPRLGCINLHPSILPRWRGATPIQRAIEAGDVETGVTIMQLDEGWDSGDILSQVHCPLYPTDTTATLAKRLSVLGADLLVSTIDRIEQQTVHPRKQEEAEVIYAAKLEKAEGKLDWSLSAEVLERKVRAFDPWPVAYTDWEGKALRIWQAEALTERSPVGIAPGTVVALSAAGIDVATGANILRLIMLQLPGGKTLAARDVINAHQQRLVTYKTRFGVGNEGA